MSENQEQYAGVTKQVFFDPYTERVKDIVDAHSDEWDLLTVQAISQHLWVVILKAKALPKGEDE